VRDRTQNRKNQNMKTISNLKLMIRNNRRWIGAALILAIATGAWAGFDQLVPQLHGGLRDGQSRLGWYVRSGQWHADMRTAVAAADYVFSPDNQALPTETPATNNQVAGAASHPLPSACAHCAHVGDPS